MSDGVGFRSLADQVRDWPDERLSALLRARPDLATPVPQDSGQLASRAATRASVARALDGLTHFELSVLGAVMSSQPVAVADLEARGLGPTLALLADRALVWSSTAGLRVVGGVAEVLTTFPTSTSPTPPEVPTTPREAGLVDKVAAAAAFEAVRRTELMLDGWGAAPPAALRSGGLSVRDLRALAARLHADEPAAALLAELAVAAGLASTAPDGDGNPCWLPTDLFDSWSSQSAEERWALLARTWLTMPRTPSLVGSRDVAGKVANALAPELVDPIVAETRRLVLEALAALPPGVVPAAGTGTPGVVARLAWLRPRRPRHRADQVVQVLTEAAALGVTGLDGLASYSRALLDGSTPALADLLPEPVDHVLLQADLTAVAPGPLEPALGRQLQLLADVESRGGATVYRFTPASVRRALDAGWSAAEVHAFLAAASRTPVPQPLTYLVDDAARTYGSIRVGHAEAFLRADDETALIELLHHPRAATLGLRRIAPTVLISSTPLDVLLPRLRELGAAPVVEAADGTVHVARPDQLRARTPREARRPLAVSAREGARVAAVVTAIRAGDAAAATRPHRDQLTPADALAVLRAAADAGEDVVITYVDNHGTITDRVVTPHRVEGGQLVAQDHRADDVRAFAVHRIRDVRSLDQGQSGAEAASGKR
ncbi:helicase-associated domain-containing protein [Nocardioides sp.]|uniref:helicase-associated domain-containing protein n=1 Tax=Nocardioides sp. TaxID=35761 RepID=UPI0039E69DD4